MSAFTGLCALRHLNLDFFCAYQITACHTKSAGCHLLDCRATILSICGWYETIQTLAALTGIGLTMQVIHSNRHRLMSFLRDGTIRHRTGFKPLDDGFYALHLVNGNTAVLRILDIQQTSEFDRMFLLIHKL